MSAASLRDQQMTMARYLRDPENQAPPEGVEDRRLKIYRELVYNNIEGFISGGFPVLRSLYEEEQWHELVRLFIDQHRCQTHEGVHSRDQFGHLGHLDLSRQLVTDDATDGDQDDGQEPEAGARADECRCHRKGHACDTVPHSALGAFLARQSTQRQDEEDSCDNVGRCCETEFH